MRRFATAALVVAGALLPATSGLRAAAAAGVGGTDEPTLYVPESAAVSQEITVRGDGWPESSLISVEICGNGGIGGSSHCDPATATTAATDRDGGLVGTMTVGEPPSPCLCVVHAFVPGTGTDVTAELVVPDLPTAPPVDPGSQTRPRLEVDARLRDASSWTTWFGAGPRRELVLVIENVGARESPSMQLEIAWGRGRSDATRIIEAPDVPSLAPGESHRLTAPVDLDPFAFGDHPVRGQIVGQPETAFAVETTAYPWGLVAMPGLVLLLLVVRICRKGIVRWRARHRSVADEPDPTDAGPVPADEPRFDDAPAADDEPDDLSAAQVRGGLDADLEPQLIAGNGAGPA